jgi:hypothetical protein
MTTAVAAAPVVTPLSGPEQPASRQYASIGATTPSKSGRSTSKGHSPSSNEGGSSHKHTADSKKASPSYVMDRPPLQRCSDVV